MRIKGVRRLICTMLIFIVFIFTMLLSFYVNARAEESTSTDDGVVAYAIFGDAVEAKGMKVWMGDENTPSVLMQNGKTAWVLDKSLGAKARYIYADIDDSILYNLTDDTNLEVIVEYYDVGNGSLAFEYPYYDVRNVELKPVYWDTDQFEKTKTKELEIQDFTDAKCWKKKSWFMQGASLKNSLQGGDFRFGIYSPQMAYSRGEKHLIHSIEIRLPNTKSQVGITVDSDHYGSAIFYTGDTMNFNCTFDNSINSFYARKNGKYDIDVIYTLLDENGGVCDVKKQTLALSPLTPKSSEVSFNVDKYGMYKLMIEAESKEHQIYSRYIENCSYVRSTKGELVNPKAGINIATMVIGQTAEDQAKMIKYAGFSMVRNCVTGIGAIARSAYGEKKTEVNEISQHLYYTSFTQALRNEGIETLIFHGWSPAASFSQWQFEYNPPYNGQYVPCTKDGYERWLLADRELSRLFGNTGHSYMYEIGNEWDLSRPIDNDFNATNTGKLYSYVYPRLKADYPDVVIGGPVTSGVNTNESWFRAFFAAGGAENIDAVTFHPYTNHGDPITTDVLHTKPVTEDCEILAIKALMDEYGIGNKELWATEWGHSAYNRVCDNPHMQAAWDAQIYLTMMQENLVSKSFVFRFDDKQDAINRGNIEYNYGIVDYKGAAKPAYLAFSNLNLEMRDAKYVSRTDVVEGKTLAYRYYKTDSKTDLMALFSNKDSEMVSYNLGTNSVVLTDMYGNKTTLVSDDGTYTFSVTCDPIYLEGNFGAYELIGRSNVGPNSTLLTVAYDQQSILSFHNETGKALDIKAETMSGSAATIVGNTKLEETEGKITLKCGSSAPKGAEPMRVTIYGDKGIYFYGDIILVHAEPVNIDISLAVDEQMNWSMITTITNNLVNEGTQGELTMISPKSWADEIKPVPIKLLPGETKKIIQQLSKKAYEDGSVAGEIAFITDKETGNGVYINNSFDFAYVRKTSIPIKIDSDLSEWTEGWMYLNKMSQFHQMTGYDNSFRGPSDLWAKIAVQWDDDNLYFAAEVHDDLFICSGVASRMWSQDNIQLGIVYDPDDKISKGSFEELSFSLLNGVPAIYRHMTLSTGLVDATKLNNYNLSIVKKDDILYYELRVAWDSIMPNKRAAELNKIKEGTKLKFGCIINESDNGDRKGFYYIGKDGIGMTKNSDFFVKMFMAGKKQ